MYSGESAPLRGGMRDAGFSDEAEKAIRHGFVRKVFGILGCQLLLTSAIAYPFVAYGDWSREFAAKNSWLYIVSMVMSLVCLCAFMCSPGLAKDYPKNYFVLFAFTAFEGILVGFICSMYKTSSVLVVFAITCVVVFGLILFACQTKYDFTGMGPYLFVALLVLCAFSFIFVFIPVSNSTHRVFAGFGALLFSFYIVYDTQLIVGGKHATCQFEVDDYVVAAINIYVDIINLFLMLLRLFGDRN